MESVEFTLPAKTWQGLVTKFPADTRLVDADQFTDGSFNFVTDKTGAITKRPDAIEYNATAFPTPPKDDYEAVFSNGIRHKLIMENGNLRYSSGGGTFAVPTNGTGFATTGNMEFALYKNRVYFGNGIDNPQVYDLATTYGGVGYTAPYVREMGVQTPVSAPTVAIAAGGAVPDGAHTYKVTFLYYDAEESNGSPASGVVTAGAGNNTTNLTAIPIGGYGVTARKIYRDDNDGVYVLVGTISDNTTTIFSDTLALGTTPIPTNNALPPLFSLIIGHRDRLWMAGISDDPSRLYWSEAGQPNIVRINNSVLCNPKDPITALIVYQDKVVVFNRNSMGLILGSTSADFRYSEISPSIGCVDNRSLVTRTLRGVPTLVWLATDNFYQFNGSSINRISDEIEDLIQLNIQQALQVKGKLVQTSQADFVAGTPSDGINLTSNPGNITTDGYMKAGDPASLTTNPTKVWDTEAEWEDGSVVSNIATNFGNQISVPTKHTPAFNAGSHNSTAEESGKLVLLNTTSTLGNHNVGTEYEVYTGSADYQFDGIAQPVLIANGGTINSFTFPVKYYYGGTQANPPITAYIAIWSNNSGEPGTVLWSTPVTLPLAFYANYTITASPSMNISAGTYWFGMYTDNNPSAVFSFTHTKVPITYSLSTYTPKGKTFVTRGTLPVYAPTGWLDLKLDGTGPTVTQCSISVSVTSRSPSGIWIGPTYDTLANAAIPSTIQHTGLFPAGTSSVTTIEGANDSIFSSGLVTETFNDLSGSALLTVTDRRYWRIKVQLATVDTYVTPQIGAPTLSYNTTGIWESEAIDHTADITTLDLLNIVGAGVVEIATSTDNVTYSSYGPVGSATPARYSKVRITLTTDGSNTTSQVVTSATLNWSLLANFISSVIDTSSAPAGWDIFQSDFSANGGSVVFEVRTASTVPGLTSATWVPVTSGAFITADPYQYLQYRATINSSANAVPVIASVTVNWLIQNVNSIRVAGLFYNGQYYIAAAEFGSSYNNIVFVYDENNTWKVFKGLNINTLGTFFTDAYYGSSIIGKMYKMFQPVQSVIDMDVRSKAFSHEIGDETKTKHLRKLVLKYKNTGCRITPSYSIDGGVTFFDMKDVTTGLSYIDTGTDGKIVLTRFVPNGVTISSGKSIMLRLYNNDDKEVQIHSMRATCWINPRQVL